MEIETGEQELEILAMAYVPMVLICDALSAETRAIPGIITFMIYVDKIVLGHLVISKILKNKNVEAASLFPERC